MFAVGGNNVDVGRKAIEEFACHVAIAAVMLELEQPQRTRLARCQRARLLKSLQNVIAARVAGEQDVAVRSLAQHHDAAQVGYARVGVGHRVAIAHREGVDVLLDPLDPFGLELAQIGLRRADDAELGIAELPRPVRLAFQHDRFAVERSVDRDAQLERKPPQLRALVDAQQRHRAERRGDLRPARHRHQRLEIALQRPFGVVDRRRKTVVPQVGDAQALFAVGRGTFEFGQQVEDSSDVIGVDMADHDHVEFARRSERLRKIRLDVAREIAFGPAIDQSEARLGIAAFEQQAIAFGGIDHVHAHLQSSRIEEPTGHVATSAKSCGNWIRLSANSASVCRPGTTSARIT